MTAAAAAAALIADLQNNDIRTRDQNPFQTVDDNMMIIRNRNTAGVANHSNDTTMLNNIETEYDFPQTAKTTKIRWMAVVALLLFSQIIWKLWANNLISVNAAVSSGVAATAITTTTRNPIMFSAVSASILRRRQKGTTAQSVNLLQVLSLTFMVWQWLTQAGTLIGIVGLYFGQFMNWYTSILSSSPLLTKTITGATIGVVGDTIAQSIERQIESTQSKNHDKQQPAPPQQQQQLDEEDLLKIYAKEESSSSDISDIGSGGSNTGMKKIWQGIRRYDGRRGASVVGESLFISGPLLHIAYDTLEHLLPTTGGGMWASVAATGHLLADNFILDPIFVAIMFVITGLAEGYSILDLRSQFRKDYPATIKATWAASILLAPVGFVCFRFLPLNYRVLGVNFIDIAWDAMISFFIHRSRRGNHQQQHQNEYEPQHPPVAPAGI